VTGCLPTLEDREKEEEEGEEKEEREEEGGTDSSDSEEVRREEKMFSFGIVGSTFADEEIAISFPFISPAYTDSCFPFGFGAVSFL
jgi:hypothetical protein